MLNFPELSAMNLPLATTHDSPLFTFMADSHENPQADRNNSLKKTGPEVIR